MSCNLDRDVLRSGRRYLALRTRVSCDLDRDVLQFNKNLQMKTWFRPTQLSLFLHNRVTSWSTTGRQVDLVFSWATKYQILTGCHLPGIQRSTFKPRPWACISTTATDMTRCAGVSHPAALVGPHAERDGQVGCATEHKVGMLPAVARHMPGRVRVAAQERGNHRYRSASDSTSSIMSLQAIEYACLSQDRAAEVRVMSLVP